MGDSPVGYWRLGETSGTTAKDASGTNPGTYRNGALLGQASLLPSDGANSAVSFDGVNDYVGIPSSTALNPTARVSVEAWIKPVALPASGSFASIASKPESYSLQFNGPRLEFTIMQSGVRRRLQAPRARSSRARPTTSSAPTTAPPSGSTSTASEVASAALTGAITANSNSLDIGSWSEGSEDFNGTIDEVAVYPVAMPAARVVAHYQAGSGAPPPDPIVKDPSNLSATAASETRIDLTWVDNSSNEGEFIIERDTSPSFASAVVEAAWANSTSFSDTGLSPGTTYYYRVRARNATDSSGYSNTANATTLAPPPPPPPPTTYSAAVIADQPVGYWRLGETSGTTAKDASGTNPGTYRNGALLGQASLLPSDSANSAVSFDGVNDYVGIPSSTALKPTARVSVEAWIKPAALPASGGFASIASKPESYSLQFNGPRLEFTIMQSRRPPAPAGPGGRDPHGPGIPRSRHLRRHHPASLRQRLRSGQRTPHRRDHRQLQLARHRLLERRQRGLQGHDRRGRRLPGRNARGAGRRSLPGGVLYEPDRGAARRLLLDHESAHVHLLLSYPVACHWDDVTHFVASPPELIASAITLPFQAEARARRKHFEESPLAVLRTGSGHFRSLWRLSTIGDQPRSRCSVSLPCMPSNCLRAFRRGPCRYPRRRKPANTKTAPEANHHRLRPGGKMFVAGRSGRVMVFDWVEDTTPTLAVSVLPEVHARGIEACSE